MKTLLLALALGGCNSPTLQGSVDPGCHWQFSEPKLSGDLPTQPVRPTISTNRANVCQGPTDEALVIWIFNGDFELAIQAPGVGRSAINGQNFALQSSTLKTCAWAGSIDITDASPDHWFAHVDASCADTGTRAQGDAYGNTL